jgi:hypothetical protein
MNMVPFSKTMEHWLADEWNISTKEALLRLKEGKIEFISGILLVVKWNGKEAIASLPYKLHTPSPLDLREWIGMPNSMIQQFDEAFAQLTGRLGNGKFLA